MQTFQTASLCQHNCPCCPSLLLTSDVHVPKGHMHHFQSGATMKRACGLFCWHFSALNAQVQLLGYMLNI